MDDDTLASQDSRIRVYAFGADPPLHGFELALRQQFLRVRYWNALVYWERQRRYKIELLVAPLVEAGHSRKEAFGALKHEVAALSAERTDYVRNQRQAIVREGLYLSGYLDIERRFNTARRRVDAPTLQGFRPERGSVNLPFTQGLAVEKLYGASRMAQIDPVPGAIYQSRATRRKGQKTLLRVRVGSKGREPVWLELPIYLHRPLPVATVVRDVRVKWQPLGRKVQYSVTITVREPAAVPTGTPTSSVALDLAWRQVDGGLRVGFWRGSDGERHDLLLDERFLERWAKVEDLHSIRMQRFNTTKLMLAEYLSHGVVSSWLAEMARTLPDFKSPWHLKAILERWTDERRVGDEEAFALATAWQSRETHLFDYESNLRDKLLRQRREIYRIAAANLVHVYDQLVLRTFDLRSVAQGELLSDSGPVVRRNRVLASPSSLRQTFANAFSREGKRVITIAGGEYTKTCHVCGELDDWDAGAQLEHQCSRCGTHWDQDDNAAANMLSRVGSQ